MSKLLYRIQFNLFKLKKKLFLYIIAIGKKHALALPRQNVTLGKMLLGKLELGKKLPRQNVT